MKKAGAVETGLANDQESPPQTAIWKLFLPIPVLAAIVGGYWFFQHHERLLARAPAAPVAVPANPAPAVAESKTVLPAAAPAVAPPTNQVRVEFKDGDTLVDCHGEKYDKAVLRKKEPDGITIAYTPPRGGMGMAKVKFKDLSEDLQNQFGYNAQKAAAYEAADKARKSAAYADTGDTAARKTLSRLVSDYHDSHTYMLTRDEKPVFACVDMACDVWNMVITKGIRAKLQVGNVEKYDATFAEANHAWVLAEVAPGNWVALEPTGGFVVDQSQNPRYFAGKSFAGPRELKTCADLLKQRHEISLDLVAAKREYDSLYEQYNQATGTARQGLASVLAQKAGILQTRVADYEKIKGQLEVLLARAD